MKVKLEDIIDGMDMQFDGTHTYLNIKTGEIITVSEDNLRIAEEEVSFDRFSKWQQDELKEALDVFENFDNYKELPTKFEIHEYSMLEDFCYEFVDGRNQDVLIKAIQGKGAFRRFKDRILQLGIEEKWYTYREQRYKELAIEWCEEQNINWD